MDGNLHEKGSQQTSSSPRLRASIKTEDSDDEEENGHDAEAASDNSNGEFFCEFCDLALCKSFQTREELITHCLECHPTACLGCFEMFASSEDLLQHLQASPHEPPVCRDCVRLFSSAREKSIHNCSVASSASEPPVPRCVIRKTATGNLLRNCVFNVKGELQDEASMSGDDVREELKAKKDCREEENEKGDSSESEDDLEEKYAPEWSSEDDCSDEEEESGGELSSNKRLVANYGPCRSSDVALHCMHCSFVAWGSERNPSIKLIRNHTFSAHPTTCSFCFESFENEEFLNEHQETLKHKVWGCKACRKMYMKKGLYNRHLVYYHPDQCPIPCPNCPARFLFPKQLKRHQKERHGGEEFFSKYYDYENMLPVNICTICDYSTQSTFAIMMHLYEKHPEPNQIPKFKCEECQIGFSRPNYFGRHILKKHADDPGFEKVFQQLVDDYCYRFECEACNKSYPSRSKYIVHLRVIHPYSMPHHCSICGIGYLDPIDLRIHECRVHRNISPFQCDHCHKIFKNLSQLVRHFHRVHKMTTMPYVYCFLHNVGFCNHNSACAHRYYKHRNQVGPKPMKCEICGKVLKDMHSYARHLLVHGSERPFKCSECEKCYVSAHGLKMHQIVHSTKHQCDVCGKSFNSESFLKRHAIVHTGEKPFECAICGLKVSQNSALKRHMDKVHPGGIVGKPRSTKPRKCRVLSKALEKQEEEEAALQNATKTGDVPSAEPNAPKAPEVSKAPPVKLDTWLLTTNIAAKPQSLRPPAARRQRRQPEDVPSEASFEKEDGFCPSPVKSVKKPKAGGKGRPSRKRKRKSSTELSSDEDGERCSESDDGDASFEPKPRTGRRCGSRRSSRLKA